MNNRNRCVKMNTAGIALVFIILVLLPSCKEKEEIKEQWNGSGVAVYLDDSQDSIRSIRIYYYVPEGVDKNSPILCLFHGLERNALEYRNALADKASGQGFILCVPEFSEETFPGVNMYQLGNVFEDGEQASTQSLLSEHSWTFSLMPKLLQFIRSKSGSTLGELNFVGHSAGAQFLHRLLLFKPEIAFEHAVISAAGWYTLPDQLVDFPYGLRLTPVGIKEVSKFYSRKISVQIGSNDNNPNASSLRRTPEADIQGTNRLERATYFFDTSKRLAIEQGIPFNWSFHVIPNLSHNFVQAVNHSAQLIFE